VRRDGEHRPRLREIVGPRKAAFEDLRAEMTELSLGVPPLLRIHLAASRDDDAQSQEPIQVDPLFHPARFLCLSLGE
jgi:hypothetical protein